MKEARQARRIFGALISNASELETTFVRPGSCRPMHTQIGSGDGMNTVDRWREIVRGTESCHFKALVKVTDPIGGNSPTI